MSNKHNRADERGNVLFLILIAVALFAALSYVVIQSGRSGGNDADVEKARLKAGEIMNYTTAIQTAVGRMLIGGCPIETISFETSSDGVMHENPKAPANEKCHVFSAPGGGVAAKKPTIEFANELQFYYSGSAAIDGLGSTCAESSCADLVFVMHDVNIALCRALNRMNGIMLPIENLPVDTQKACPYRGTFDCNGDDNVEVVFSAPGLFRKNSICYNDSVHGLTFMHALLER